MPRPRCSRKRRAKVLALAGFGYSIRELALLTGLSKSTVHRTLQHPEQVPPSLVTGYLERWALTHTFPRRAS